MSFALCYANASRTLITDLFSVLPSCRRLEVVLSKPKHRQRLTVLEVCQEFHPNKFWKASFHGVVTDELVLLQSLTMPSNNDGSKTEVASEKAPSGQEAHPIEVQA